MQIFQGARVVAVLEITQGALVQTGGVAQLFLVGQPVVCQLAYHLSSGKGGEMENGGEQSRRCYDVKHGGTQKYFQSN